MFNFRPTSANSAILRKWFNLSEVCDEPFDFIVVFWCLFYLAHKMRVKRNVMLHGELHCDDVHKLSKKWISQNVHPKMKQKKKKQNKKNEKRGKQQSQTAYFKWASMY